MKTLSCSIIITNWNGQDLLRECLPTVLSAVQEDRVNHYEVIVVDDCSTDSSVEFLKTNFPEVQVLVPKKNLGFQRANNFGVRKSRYDLVMLLNNDIKVDSKALVPLIRHFQDTNVFAVSGKVYDWEGNFLYGNRGGYFKSGHFYLYEKEENSASQSLFACGGAGMFHKEKFLQLGGFDNLYHPLYYEEIDVSYRALKKGWKVVYEPDSVVYHRVQQTITKQHQKKKIKYISGRNNYLFVAKNITDFGLLFSGVFFVPYFLLKDLFKLKFRFWVCFWLASLRLPRLIKAKLLDLKVKNIYSDQEVLSWVNKD